VIFAFIHPSTLQEYWTFGPRQLIDQCDRIWRVPVQHEATEIRVHAIWLPSSPSPAQLVRPLHKIVDQRWHARESLWLDIHISYWIDLPGNELMLYRLLPMPSDLCFPFPCGAALPVLLSSCIIPIGSCIPFGSGIMLSDSSFCDSSIVGLPTGSFELPFLDGLPSVLDRLQSLESYVCC